MHRNHSRTLALIATRTFAALLLVAPMRPFSIMSFPFVWDGKWSFRLVLWDLGEYTLVFVLALLLRK